ncbi:MAG: hypothetical protein ACK5PS_11985 [Desulfopila sp.]
MARSVLPPYILDLLRPESYPHRVDEVTLVQTHISYLLFAGDFVYKWKKPVNFGFVDFSTRRRRRFFCEEEVRLNRRLCGEMYRGVVQVKKAGERYLLNGPGEGGEYGVKMRRLPLALMMDHLIADNRLGEHHLEKVVDRLVAFYRVAEIMPASSGYGSAGSVRKMIDDNFQETGPYIGGPALARQRFANISRYTASFLADSGIFERRAASGRVRDCHGDLHSANICLTDDVTIFDCIEFNPSLRCTDIAADVAFLAMDLDFHGLGELSHLFIRRCIDCTGDEGLLEVLNFYKCYRAYVRGKVGLLTAAGAGADRAAAARAMAVAERYFRLAEEYSLRQ